MLERWCFSADLKPRPPWPASLAVTPTSEDNRSRYFESGSHGLSERAYDGSQGRAAWFELAKVDSIFVGFGLLPAAPEDAEPFEGQRPKDRPVPDRLCPPPVSLSRPSDAWRFIVSWSVPRNWIPPPTTASPHAGSPNNSDARRPSPGGPAGPRSMRCPRKHSAAPPISGRFRPLAGFGSGRF